MMLTRYSRKLKVKCLVCDLVEDAMLSASGREDHHILQSLVLYDNVGISFTVCICQCCYWCYCCCCCCLYSIGRKMAPV